MSIARKLMNNGFYNCDLAVRKESDFEEGININKEGIESVISKYGRLIYEG
jgi:hypothetical protein